MAKRDLLFRYLGDSKSLSKASGRAERALGGVDKKSRIAGKGMGLARGAAGKLGLVLGGAALLGGAAKAVKRAEDLNSAYAATEQIILQTGDAAGLTGKDIKDLATESSILTGIDKELILQGDNLILTFKNIKNEGAEPAREIFQRTHDIMLDLSTVMGTDAKSAALQLGKALNDPVKGLTSLQRIGVAFTDVQKEQIRGFVEAGDVAGAQGIILDELESQVGGVAVATADSTAKISNAWKEVQEQIGNVLLPAIDALVPAFQKVGREAPAAFEKMGDAVGAATRRWEIWNATWDDTKEAIFQVNIRMGDYQQKLEDGTAESNIFAGALVNMQKEGDAYEETIQNLIDATDISNESLGFAIDILLDGQKEYGLTAEQIAELETKQRELTLAMLAGNDPMSAFADVTGDVGDAAGDAIGPLEDMAGAEDDVANRGKDALAAVNNLKGAMKELTDPVFAAKRATEKLEETLERIQEDLVVTEDEAAELTQAWIDQQVAADKVSAGNVIAVGEATTEAMGLIREGVEITKGSYASLLTATSSDIRAFINAAQVVASTPLRVEIVASAPSKATMIRLVKQAIVSEQRRGGF